MKKNLRFLILFQRQKLHQNKRNRRRQPPIGRRSDPWPPRYQPVLSWNSFQNCRHDPNQPHDEQQHQIISPAIH